MDRRGFLGATAAAALAGCARAIEGGCGGATATTVAPSTGGLDLPAEDTYAFGEAVPFRFVHVAATGLRTVGCVEYTDPGGDTTHTWKPGDDRWIVVVSYRAENRSDEAKTYPNWDNFRLRTPAGTVDPRLETPDGVSVEALDATTLGVTKARQEQMRAGQDRVGWSGVFVAGQYHRSEYAVQWDRPDGNRVFWRPD